MKKLAISLLINYLGVTFYSFISFGKDAIGKSDGVGVDIHSISEMLVTIGFTSFVVFIPILVLKYFLNNKIKEKKMILDWIFYNLLIIGWAGIGSSYFASISKVFGETWQTADIYKFAIASKLPQFIIIFIIFALIDYKILNRKNVG